MNKVFYNGDLKGVGEAAVPVGDTGLLYGAGVFETMRAEGGKVWRFERHMERMRRSGEALSVMMDFDNDHIAGAVSEVMEANGLIDARVRVTVTNGWLDEQGKARGSLVVAAGELGGYPAECYEKGVRVVVTDFKQNGADPLCGHKSTSYYSRLLVLNAANAKGASEALWFNTDNYLAEGCVSNVFLVKEGRMLTPGLDTPVLGGIVRREVLEVAGDMGLDSQEGQLTVNDLLGAEEVFLTNVMMLALPVVAVEGHVVGGGKCGEVTGEVLVRLRKRIAEAVK
jgi:branched-subunit amino acid aminotransferase/4-amino-4-deoxychorismate lyase